MPARLRTPLKVRRDGRIPYTVLYRAKNAAGKMYPTSYSFYAIAGNEASVAAASQAADELIALMNTPGISPEAALAAHPKIDGDVVEPRQLKGPLLADWVNQVLDDNPNDAAPDTVDKHKTYVINDMVPFFGADKRLADVTAVEIRDWIRWLKRKNKPSTVKKKVTVLSRALRVATKERKIALNPMLDDAVPKLPKIGKVEKTLTTVDEFFAIRDAFRFEGYQWFYEFLVASGCRYGEATAVKPGDFDILNSKVRIERAWSWGRHDGPGTKKYYKLKEPKTETSKRTVDIPPELIDQLTILGYLKPDREWVFLNTHGGPIRQHTFINGVFEKTLKRVQLGTGRQKPKIKDMRDAYIGWHMNNGTPGKVVQENVGHAHLSTTENIYARMDQQKSRAAAGMMGGLLRYGDRG
jgi:integrase